MQVSADTTAELVKVAMLVWLFLFSSSYAALCLFSHLNSFKVVEEVKEAE